jgi:hypothetical protein
MSDVNQLHELQQDGDTVLLANGKSLRIRVVPDGDTQINDFDCYGKVEWARINNGEGRNPRPSEFDGNAEIIDVDWPSQCWWQPPVDIKRSDEHFGSLRQQVKDLVHYGFVGYVLEELSGEDAYGKPIVSRYSSIWGVEWGADRAYITTLIEDLEGELSANWCYN